MYFIVILQIFGIQAVSLPVGLQLIPDMLIPSSTPHVVQVLGARRNAGLQLPGLKRLRDHVGAGLPEVPHCRQVNAHPRGA